mgnify:CR=1 FL=1
MNDKKHVKFQGRLVIVGFGSVGQGSLPLLLRHIDMPLDRICILTGDPRGKEAGPIRAAMRRQFYPETDDWKEAVLFRGHQLVRQAVAGVQKGAL